MIILKSIFISGLQKYTLRIIFIEGLQVLCNYDHIEKHFDLGASSFRSFLSRGSIFYGLFLKGTRIFFCLRSSAYNVKNLFYRGAPSFMQLWSYWKAFWSMGSKFCVISIEGLHVLWAFFERYSNFFCPLIEFLDFENHFYRGAPSFLA
jgi:hypothetical protein